MAVADRSIDPRILESARSEFLANGFETASLKSICEGAGVTTGALYKRYKGKEDLFSRRPQGLRNGPGVRFGPHTAEEQHGLRPLQLRQGQQPVGQDPVAGPSRLRRQSGRRRPHPAPEDVLSPGTGLHPGPAPRPRGL